jgi:hypothetical protein
MGISNCIGPLFVLFIGVLGCSSGARMGVEGRVTYAGEPLPLGSITFIPESDKAIKSGGTITNGRYKIEPRFGLLPGPHRVEIRWAKPTGKKYTNEFGEVLDVRQEGLPDKYHTKSSLTATIKRGANTIDFDLEK